MSLSLVRLLIISLTLHGLIDGLLILEKCAQRLESATRYNHSGAYASIRRTVGKRSTSFGKRWAGILHFAFMKCLGQELEKKLHPGSDNSKVKHRKLLNHIPI